MSTKRDKRLHRTFYMPPRFYGVLKVMADIDGQTISGELRGLISSAATKRGVWSTTAEVVSQMEPVPIQEVQQ
jgi:hypothetical protein